MASQPSPPLNAVYKGPVMPTNYAARRNGPSCLFYLHLKVGLAVILLGGAAVLVLWLIFLPYNLKAYADSAELSRFDLGGGGGGRDLLQYNLPVNIRLRNKNRFGIRYDYVEAQAFYDGVRFGFTPLQPLHLERKSEETITAAFNGTAMMDDDDVHGKYREETRDGFYYVKVRVYSDLNFDVRVFRLRDHKSKIGCMLRLPVPTGDNAGSTPMMSLGTRCDVDF